MAVIAPPSILLYAVAISSLLFLAFLGAIGAKAGGANMLRQPFASPFGRIGHGNHGWYWGSGRHSGLMIAVKLFGSSFTKKNDHRWQDAGQCAL